MAVRDACLLGVLSEPGVEVQKKTREPAKAKQPRAGQLPSESS